MIARSLALLLMASLVACAGELSGEEGDPEQRAPSSAPADPSRVLLSETFDSGLAAWTRHAIAPSSLSTVEGGYLGGKRLRLDYRDATQHVMASRSLDAVSEVLVRTYFYDTGEPSLGSLFCLYDASQQGQTGLGVVPQVSRTS